MGGVHKIQILIRNYWKTFYEISSAKKLVGSGAPTHPTPYSMNRLFSEFFRDFSGVILEVCETIWGIILEVFW